MNVGAIGSTYTDAARGDAYAAALKRFQQGQVADDSAGESTLSRTKSAPQTVGFGSNSVTLPGLAAKAIRTNLSEGKKAVPTIAENDARVREQLSQARRQAPVPELPSLQSIDYAHTNQAVASQATRFLSTLNSAAGTALARTGQGEANAQSGPTVQVGDTQIPLKKQDKRTLDLLA